MNKRTIGIILVILAVITAGVLFKNAFIDKKEKVQDDFVAEEQQEQETVQEEEIMKDDGLGTQEPEIQEVDSFSKLHSVIEYDIPDEIADYLDPVSFDEAMVDYLLEEKLIGQGAHEVLAENLYLLKSDGFITIDVNNDVYLFDLKLSDKDRTIIHCAADNLGHYDFEH